MNGIEKKLKVLSDIAHALNARHVVWAVGASALLYFKGKTDSFHDIDLMVKESDAETAKEQLLQLGSLLPPEPNTQYQTRCFLEFEINGVDVDMMAGFVIVRDGKSYECPFSKEQVEETVTLHGETIPLQSLSD